MEHLCDDQEGNRNNTDDIWIEHRQGHTQMWENILKDLTSNLYGISEKSKVTRDLLTYQKQRVDNVFHAALGIV